MFFFKFTVHTEQATTPQHHILRAGFHHLIERAHQFLALVLHLLSVSFKKKKKKGNRRKRFPLVGNVASSPTLVGSDNFP